MQQRTIDRTRAPLLLLEAGMQRARLEGVRYAITTDALDQRRARQGVDFEKLLLAGASSQRWLDRVNPAADRLEFDAAPLRPRLPDRRALLTAVGHLPP